MRSKLTNYWINILTSYVGVKHINLPIMNKHDSRTISVVIPHFNRSALIYSPLRNIIHDKRIGEIVIYDDGSDSLEFEAMKNKSVKLSDKIKVIRNEENLGAFRAKLEGIKLAKSEWVILLDSDNFLFQNYLNTIFQVKKWNNNNIYCADFAYPNYDFTRWGGQTFDMNEIRQMLREKQYKLLMLMNDGNYFVNRERYINTAEPFKEIDVLAVDVLAFNYLWLSRGGKLQVLKRVKYYHRVHEGSYFLKTEKESTILAESICQSITMDKPHQFQ